jgi:manganese transport protein
MGSFTNKTRTTYGLAVIIGLIVVLNVWLLYSTLSGIGTPG